MAQYDGNILEHFFAATFSSLYILLLLSRAIRRECPHALLREFCKLL